MLKDDFLKDLTNYSNHRPLLWDALELTKDSPEEIIEMGCGWGSTPYLHDYCKANKRILVSYENDFEWWRQMSEKFTSDFHKIIHVTDWDIVHSNHKSPAVVLLDNRPGERRKIDLELLANQALIVVAHDTEKAADHGYQMRQHFTKYKYWRDFSSDGAGATILSNFIEV